MNANPSERRDAVFASLSREPSDVLIIGGGIVGAGIARDAAMRGLRTALIEQRDFASGASSHTSRLLHGGLRYLAQGRLGLVREASVEKTILHRIAPHLAQPLRFIFPAYRGTSWPLWQLRMGVKIYDLLCSGRNFGKSEGLSRKEVLETVPGLNDNALLGAASYFDAFTNDARLVLDTLRSASKHGARALNYCQLRNASASNSIWNCQVEEKLNGRIFNLSARAVVNATGPWAQGVPHSGVQLRATKGVHLVVPRERLPVPNAVVMTESERILFVIPWGQRCIVGTTDTDYKGRPDEARVEKADVEYLLRVVKTFFPSVKLASQDLISAFAGVRPLIADSHGGASDISRAHQIRSPEPNWWDVAGGKLTTYRLMAEQTVDKLIAAAGLRGGPCRTAAEPLLGPSEADGTSGVLPPDFNLKVVEHFCANEWAIHLDDVMVRRAGWHYYHADACAKAEQAAQWMGGLLGWSDVDRKKELGRYKESAAF